MHRTKTRFAARINRVASGLERRGVVATYEVHDRLLANRSSRQRYTQDRPSLDNTQQRIVDRLREEGFATLPLSELIPDPTVWRELEDLAERSGQRPVKKRGAAYSPTMLQKKSSFRCASSTRA